MNTRMIGFLLGRILMVEAGLLALPLLTALLYGEPLMPWLATMLVLAAIGWGLSLRKPERTALYAKDGFAAVALVWLLMSAFGALPFVLSGDIPNYIDAFFETVSGFTTTGASILTAVEPLSRGGLLWRSFTHWVGGMGVLVFVMAILPMSDGHTMHILRAEMPGPTAGKLVSRMSDTAKILYGMYFVMTIVMIVLLLLGGMDLFDASVHAFGTAGTGGFSSRNASVGAYNSAYRHRYRDAGLRRQLQSVLFSADTPLPGRGQVRGAVGISGHRGLFHRYHRGQYPPSVRRGGDFSAPRLFPGVLHHHHHRLCYGGF